MSLVVPSPAAQETAYRRHLRRHATRTWARISQDIEADVSDIDADTIAAYLLILAGVNSYNRRKITANFRDKFKPAKAEKLLKRALDPDVSAALDVARVANMELIKDISAEQKRKLFKAIADVNPKIPLEEQVAKILPDSKKRAKLIARDQTSKTNSALSRIRHMAAGASRYKWRGVNDERRREDHARVEGEVYEYGEPTGTDSGAEPGQDIQCRCSAEPEF